MVTISIDTAKFNDALEKTIDKKRYKLGAKPPLGVYDWKYTDCSGYVRWLLHEANPELKIPSGSVLQRRWCENMGFKKTAGGYNVGAALKDNRLRIAFMKPRNGQPGHVWLVLNGQTIESYAGHGPGRRPWDALRADVCYVLTEPLE